MEEHIYTSANGEFLPWNEWVFQYGTLEDKIAHMQEESSIEKDELLQRWIIDQKINSYVHKIDGEIVQRQEWKWST